MTPNPGRDERAWEVDEGCQVQPPSAKVYIPPQDRPIFPRDSVTLNYLALKSSPAKAELCQLLFRPRVAVGCGRPPTDQVERSDGCHAALRGPVLRSFGATGGRRDGV